MRARLAILSAVALLALAAQGWAGPAAEFVAGNEHGLWHVKLDAEANTFSVAVKPLNKQWRWAGEDIRGRVVAAAAVDEKLHVMFAGGAQQIYPVAEGVPSVPAASLGSSPLATCEAPAGFAGAAAPSLLAIILAEKAPAAGAEPGRLAIVQYTAGAWKTLDVAGPTDVPDNATLLAATLDGTFYLLIAAPSGRANRLLTWRAGKWEALALLGMAAEGEAVALVAMPSQLVLLLAGPAADRPASLELTMAKLIGPGPQWEYQPVLGDGQSTWPIGAAPMAARLGPDYLAMLWRGEAGRLLHANCGLNGRLLPAAEVGLPKQLDSPHGALVVMEYFMWGVLLVTLVAMVLLRPQGLPQPFVLPEALRPAPLLRRVLAALIDFVPFCLLASAPFTQSEAFQPSQNWQQAMQAAEQLSRRAEFAMAMVAALTLYAVYGIAMELRFGATLGKMIMKLRVVGNGGQRPAVRAVLMRNLIRLLEINLLMLPLIVPIIVVMTVLSRYHQRLGDLLARTAVVDVRGLGRIEDIRPAEPQPPQEKPPGGPPGD